jgi:3-dehydroquinate synthase
MILYQIQVALGERSYPIYVGRSMTSLLPQTLHRHSLPTQLAIITDKNVARYHLKPLLRCLTESGMRVTTILVPPGERQKSLTRANAIYTDLLRHNFGRASTILAFGGGVIGDLAGFVAATYHRGVPLVQIPTTLLSQVDSSVGGKVAVNHPLGKNMIGAFYQPTLVWTDMHALTTLPQREVVCGLGEIIKYGVIKDADLFEFLEKNIERVVQLDNDAVAYVQQRCCTLKAQITSDDEKERGIRIILNFGHTIGHALEAAGNYRLLKHGEAVLLGMIAESYLATKLGLFPNDQHHRLVALITRIPLRTRHRTLNISAIRKSISYDKKGVGTKKRFVLPVRIGEVQTVTDIPESLLLSSLQLILRQQW